MSFREIAKTNIFVPTLNNFLLRTVRIYLLDRLLLVQCILSAEKYKKMFWNE